MRKSPRKWSTKTKPQKTGEKRCVKGQSRRFDNQKENRKQKRKGGNQSNTRAVLRTEGHDFQIEKVRVPYTRM